MPPSPIVPSVDFDADGAQHGHLRLPWSRDDSAWGSLPIPVSVIGRGDGPTALLTGGNHGDEFEGPIALLNLARTLDPARMKGRVIILPGLNYPALCAGLRTSPIDGGNMNRSFPGRPDGTLTEKIADYVQRDLLPRADLVADIHSGGKTLEFLPFAACHRLDDKAQEARCRAARDAFGAPYALAMREIDPVGMLDTAAEEMGKTFVTTELAGGGTTRPETLRIAERGITNLLIHMNILDGEPEVAAAVHLAMPDDDCFAFAEHGGLIEPCTALGDEVAAGDLLARVHDLGRTGVAPIEYRAPRAGMLAGRHYPGLIQPGDFLAVIADVVDE
jgi:N2-acetyl-L-2,4-diaminobutanoate deacetylase